MEGVDVDGITTSKWILELKEMKVLNESKCLRIGFSDRNL